MIPSLSIGPRTLLNDCNHSATAIFRRSAILFLSGGCRIPPDVDVGLDPNTTWLHKARAFWRHSAPAFIEDPGHYRTNPAGAADPSAT